MARVAYYRREDRGETGVPWLTISLACPARQAAGPDRKKASRVRNWRQ